MMRKSYRLTIRLDGRDYDRLMMLADRYGAKMSTVARLALMRLIDDEGKATTDRGAEG